MSQFFLAKNSPKTQPYKYELRICTKSKSGSVYKTPEATVYTDADYIGEDEGLRYYSNNLLVLVWEVFKHRCWHLKRGDGWVD